MNNSEILASTVKSNGLLPLLVVVSTESCSESGPMVRLADVTVGCKDRPGMGWMTTLAGTELSDACAEAFCEPAPDSAVTGWASRLPCCRVCCRMLGSICKAAQTGGREKAVLPRESDNAEAHNTTAVTTPAMWCCWCWRDRVQKSAHLGQPN